MATTTSKRVTVPAILSRKSAGSKKISALTVYDYTTARILDDAGIDILLVGDSLGCVVQGHDTTLPVTLSDVIYHCRAVSRGAKRALVIGDMPFLSYQPSIERAVESAGLLLKEGGAAAVKLEGGTAVVSVIEKIVSYDIPVMGHVGLTPQSYHRMGGNRVQGKREGDFAGSRSRIIDDALAVQDAGAFALVIESVPAALAEEITSLVTIPTIGIGAGAGCDGQILVSSDMLGMIPDFAPKFVKRYAALYEEIRRAASDFAKEVQEGSFPSAAHEYTEEPARSLKTAALRIAPRSS